MIIQIKVKWQLQKLNEGKAKDALEDGLVIQEPKF